MNVAVTYNGTTLQVTITDAVTLATATQSYIVNIPTLLGANTVWAGFTGGTGGLTGGGGTGGAPECTVPSECGVSDDCHSFTCDDGKCADLFTMVGTKTMAQAIGDCVNNVCDGNGAIVTENDGTDVFDDQNDCSEDVCVAGAAMNNALPAGSACATNGGKFCDGAKSCVECLMAGDCATGVCSADNKCAPAMCGDGVKNGAETAVDCGGGLCGKCAADLACLVAGDCMDGVCDPVTKLCKAATCTDSVKNAGETDIDCGGALCPDCDPGELCGNPADCTSGVCSGVPLKCQVPTCMDNVTNGAETDKDCGGPLCNDCIVGKLCAVAADCVTSVCSGNPKTCQMATCSDNAKNGAETAVDCGGGLCPACPLAAPCNINADCMSGFCNAAKVCATPNCMDNAKNGTETAVDCGGPSCPDCANGLTCNDGTDCLSTYCYGNPKLCQATLNGCTLATAQDQTGANLTEVVFGGLSYSPPCIKIKAGKTVRFSGFFPGHPLRPGTVAQAFATLDAGSPIPSVDNDADSMVDVVFPTPGGYGYYCNFHYPSGMFGAVFVVP